MRTVTTLYALSAVPSVHREFCLDLLPRLLEADRRAGHQAFLERADGDRVFLLPVRVCGLSGVCVDALSARRTLAHRL